MLNNYLLVAFRHIVRGKWYSLLNILAIAWLTVIFQAVKAAGREPVKSLRHE